MSSWTSYNSLGNTVTYDSDLPTSISVPNVESLAFGYDGANRITKITNGMNSDFSQTIGYDGLGRITTVSSGVDTSSFAYDADGNRLQEADNGTETTFTYASNSNRLTSTSGHRSATYGYNADGNITTLDGHGAYTYGPFNQLMNASGTGFMISAAGLRLEKAAASGDTYFAPGMGGSLMAEDVDGAWKDYVWLNGRMVEMVTAGGVYSLHGDQTGRVLAITDPASHAIDWAAVGLPFDRDTTSGSGAFFRLGYPGQYWDVEDQLWHNGARDYDPWLGRYIESDPIGLLGGVNTYIYVGDNPNSLVDPLGLCPTCSQLQQAAAQLAEGFEHDAHVSEALEGAGALATALGVVGEPDTAGLDTPFTLSAGSVTTFFAGAATVSNGLSAGLREFASGGNAHAIANFAVNAAISSGIRAAAEDSHIGFVSRFADNLGQLAGQAASLAEQAQKACQSQ